MKKLLGLAGAAFLFPGAALAADLARKAPVYTPPPPPPPPVFTWQGWYIGGNAGYGWGENTSPTFFTTTLGGLPTALPNLKPKGFIGGGQIGYDWRFGNWVWGLVADFQGADIKDSRTVTPVGPLTTQSLSESEKLDFLGTGRGRLGWAYNNWLFYGSGGLAYGDVRSTVGFSAPTLVPPASLAGSHSETRAGWAAGGGINYAFTPNWIGGADYLHYDLDRTRVTAFSAIDNLTVSQKVQGDIVRGVINYKF